MAELSGAQEAISTIVPIPARVQLMAVAWLRWRLFVNAFVRRKPKSTEQVVGIVFAILLRIVIWPIIALMVIGPVAFSGFLAWELMSENHPQDLAPVLAGLMIFWQFVSVNGINIATSKKTFDPSTLTRFPIPFPRYLLLRTLIGLLTASTIVGCLASLAIAVGIGVARLELLLPALVVMSVFALMNIFFTRMLAVWFERWLANRRFREIFSVLMAAFFIGIQITAMTPRAMYTHHDMMPWYMRIAHNSAATLGWLPPGLAAHAILSNGQVLAGALRFAVLLAYTALFLAIFALRLHKQFLGELLVDSPLFAVKVPVKHAERIAKMPAARTAIAPSALERSLISPVIAACVRKEFLVLKANTQMLIGLFTPLVFVFILGRGVAAKHAEYFLPTALGYVLLGLVGSFYNVFGADGAGVQLYLMAPVRLSNVIVAKNITQLILVTMQVSVAWALVVLLAQRPIPLSAQIAAGLWLVFFVATNLTFGALRSIQAPQKYVPGQTRQMRQTTPTNRTSGLLVLAVLIGGLVLQAPVTFAGNYFHLPWLGAAVFSVLAAAAVGGYILLLRSAEKLMLNHRDTLAEELCRTA